MPFLIENQGKIPTVLTFFKDVEAYFKALNIKKLGLKTLQNKLKVQGDSIVSGTYKITRVEIGEDDRYRKADKTIQNANISEVPKEVDEYASDAVIRKFIERDEQETLIEYDNTLIINSFNMYEFIQQITEEIKKRGYDGIKNRFFQVIFELTNGTFASTKYLYYNILVEALLDLLTKWLYTYDKDEVGFKKVFINSISAPDDENLIIYGTKVQQFDSYVVSLKNLIEGMILDNDSNKMLIKLSDENYIYKPSTTKNCFIQACYMAVYKRYDVATATEEFLRRHPMNVRNLKILGMSMSYYLRRKINVYVLSNGLNKLTYSEGGEHKKEINILIVANHAHALISNKDIKDFDVEEFNKMMSIKDYDEVQRPINEQKKMTKINEDGDEVEMDDDEIELYELEKEGKAGKYNDFTICTYDFETCDASMDAKIKQSTIAYAGGFYDGKEYKEIYKTNINDDVIKNFLDYLEDNKIKKMILYGHNAGKFDIYILIRAIIQRKGWCITAFLEQGGRIINLVIKTHKGKQIIFRDSFNFIACSLDDACKDFKPKTKKLEGDVNHNLINIDNCFTTKIYEYTHKYLKNDCLSLHEILGTYGDILKNRFNIDIKNVLTNASIARTYYLKQFYKPKETPIFTLPKSIDTKLRKYYFGGRNECMTKLGYQKGKFYYLDFTSLYPHMMHKHEFPYGKIKETIVDTNVFNDKWFGFVKCKFRHVNRDSIPLHAVLKNHKLMFPYCEDWQKSILTTEEIKYSIDNKLGYEYQFDVVYTYEKKGYIFKDCVEDLYKLKLHAEDNGNDSLRSMAKIIINSLYGFWGINFYNRDQKRLLKFTDDKNINKDAKKEEPDNEEQPKKKRVAKKTADEKRQHTLQRYLLGQKLKNYNRVGDYDVFDVVDKIRTQAANVGLAFFTTSYARMHLYKLLKDIKDRGGKTFYMDTDSVVTDYDIYKDEEMKAKWVGTGGKLLGELKNETGLAEGYYTELITLGNKFYALRNPELNKKSVILKMKGVNGKAKYINKSIDHDKKIIYLKDLDKYEGKECITFDDYKLMADNYNLNVSNMSFISGVNNVIVKQDDLIKLNNDKTVKRLYDKGIVDEYDNITPLILKN